MPSVHSDRIGQGGRSDTRNMSDAVEDVFVGAGYLVGSDAVRSGIEMRKARTSSGPHEPGIHVPQCLERAGHQAGADQQNQGQGDL